MRISDHGGAYGGGKYRKGSDIDVLHTDLNSFPLVTGSTGANWNASINQFTHYADGSQGIRYPAGSYQWLASFGTPSFSICPNSTTTLINYMYKLASGKFIYFQSNYIYTFTPPSSTAGLWYPSTASINIVHYVWEVGNYMYILHDYNILTIMNTSTATPTFYARRTISNLSAVPTNVYVVEYGAHIYVKYSNPDGVLAQLKKDMLNDTVPVPVRVSSNIRGVAIDVSENYISIQNLNGTNLGIYNRSDFTLIREITMSATSIRPFIDEKNKVVMVGASGEPSGLSVYSIESGSLIFSQITGTAAYYHIGSRTLDGKEIVLVSSIRDTSGNRLPTRYTLRRTVKLIK